MKPDFNKLNGLLPVIVQDSKSKIVLMLGFMNEEAFEKTIKEKKVTFYSRSKKRLWTKGETSGNFLNVDKILIDCDNDTLLIKADPKGPACHTGNDTCFQEENRIDDNFVDLLENIIKERKSNPIENSYTSALFEKGIDKIAQKVGEEATEVVIESIKGNKKRLIDESADLIFHFLVLLSYYNLSFEDILLELENRHLR